MRKIFLLSTALVGLSSASAYADNFQKPVTGSLGVPNGAAQLDTSRNVVASELGNVNLVQFISAGATYARSMNDRFADHINVRDFGAKCNGVADDAPAFNAAAAAATATPRNSNSGTEIDTPSGRCMFYSPWLIQYQNPNTAIRLHGDGSAMTELDYVGGIDGIKVLFAPNPKSNYASNVKGNGNEAARSTNWPGQAISIDGFSLLADTQSKGRVGTALSVTAIPLINASDPPFQTYSDILMTGANGYDSGANTWAAGILLTDPDNAFIKQARFLDHALASNNVSIPFHIHSTFVLGNGYTGGHGNINISDSGTFGGNIGILIDGNGIQGVNLSHVYTTFVQTGISWKAPLNSLTGSLTIDHSSISAQQTLVDLDGVSTVYSDDNFFYNVAPTPCRNETFVSVKNGDTIHFHDDIILGPTAGYQTVGSTASTVCPAGGPTYTSTAFALTSLAAYDVQQSLISGMTINHFDNGIVQSGGPISYKGVSVSSDTTNCYSDAGTSTNSALHPNFDGISCGQAVVEHDGQGTSLAFDYLVQRYMNGGLELGLPGIKSPGGITGYAGGIDWHSAASTDGTLNGLSDFDFRMSPFGGTSGYSGLGGMHFYGLAGVTMNGPLANSHGLFTLGGDNAAAMNLMGKGLGNSYDAQLIVSGGTSGTPGQGTLDVNAATVRLNGDIQATSFTLPRGLLSVGGTYAAALNLKGAGSTNSYDAQIIEDGTVIGTLGQGVLYFNDLFSSFNSPVLVPSIRYIGFAVPAAPNSACTQGTSGDGMLNGVPNHFFCYATNQWARWPSVTPTSATAW